MNKREEKLTREEQFKRLIYGIMQNSHAGLKKFYETYGTLLQTTAQMICHSRDKANEVVNDVLVKIWRLAPTLLDIKNPEGWLFVITVNAAKDAMREPYVLPLEENMIAGNDAIQEMIDEDSFYSLIQCLNDVERKIIICKFILSYTFQEIANDLEKPLTTVTSLYYRALEKIKKDLENQEEYA